MEAARPGQRAGEAGAGDLPYVGLIADEFERQFPKAFLMLGDEQLAAEAVHAALTSCARRIEQGGIRSVHAYVSRSVVNACISAQRRERVRRRCIQLLGRSTETTSEFEKASAEHIDLVNALQRLPARQRAAILLRYFEDLSESEIADVLGCRAGSVGPLLSRAKTRLRKDLR